MEAFRPCKPSWGFGGRLPRALCGSCCVWLSYTLSRTYTYYIPAVSPYICVLLFVETVLGVWCLTVFLTIRNKQSADADQPAVVVVVSFPFFFFKPRGPFSRSIKPGVAWACFLSCWSPRLVACVQELWTCVVPCVCMCRVFFVPMAYMVRTLPRIQLSKYSVRRWEWEWCRACRESKKEEKKRFPTTVTVVVQSMSWLKRC